MLSRPTSHALRHLLRVSSGSCQCKPERFSGPSWARLVQVINQKCQIPHDSPEKSFWRRNWIHSMNSERKTKTPSTPKHFGGRPHQLSLSLIVLSPEKRNATVVIIIIIIITTIIVSITTVITSTFIIYLN